MPSQTYRYYRLDGIGQLYGADWLTADSDDDAVAKAREQHPDSKCEIWQGSRLVATVTPSDGSA
jgi:hypothetical protein